MIRILKNQEPRFYNIMKQKDIEIFEAKLHLNKT